MTAAIPGKRGSSLRRRSVIALVGLAAVGALSVATLSNSRLSRVVGEGLSEGKHGIETVAAMLAERSPGERPEGALANLKPKRQPAIHERALPKIRGPFAPPTPYEALVTPPPSPPIAPPPAAPLYNVVAGGPPEAITPPNGTPGGGPPILSNIPPPGGGGGFTPPVITTSEVPPPPPPAVPEPASWAMMLLGFVLMGRVLRRKQIAGPRPARG